MLKNMTRVVSKSNNLAQHHSYRGGLSKTKPMKRGANDRPIASPRLKSFPAEKIKRTDSSPIQNNSENGNMPPSQIMNFGQGDSPPYSQNPQIPRSLWMPNATITSMSEPRVSQNVGPTENRVNQSESVIHPSRIVVNSAIDFPHHRPRVPNVRQADAEFGSNFPRKLAVNVPHESLSISQEKMSPIAEKEAVQPGDPWKIENEATKKVSREHEERFPEMDRSKVMPNLHERTIVPGPVVAVEKSLVKDPNLANCSQTGEGICPIFSREIQPTPRPNISHYYNVDNNNNVWASGKGQFFQPNLGMTSPQDNAINQVKNCQRCLQLGKYVCRPNQPTNWFRHNEQRSMNNLPPMEYTNVPQYCNHPTHNVAASQHQNSQGYWHPPVQQQYYYRQIPWQPSNNAPIDESPHEKSQLLQSGITYQHGRAAKNPDLKQQHVPQRNYVPIEVPQQQPIIEKSENARSINAKKKPLRFTSAMIRDQEMLIATMRQQGISEDIMRRQFDAMLTEQRKQLLYFQQLENPEKNEKRLPQGVRVHRKISKIEEDGKPEWMLHITPPRIPYSVVGKMQAERHPNSQAMTLNDRNMPQIHSAKQPHHQRNDACGQNLQEYHQHPGQNTGYNSWQQHSQYPYVLSENINMPHEENQTYDPSGHALGDYQERKLNNQLPVSPKSCQNDENHNEKKRQYEEPERSAKVVEPSSLLKLRIQKNVIKRQKQNNGLQDSETIKKAMQALRNSANRKGLEYLENLNKKSEKPVLLNGAQDPCEMDGTKQQESYNCEKRPTKIVSFNGLENSRNSNNPPPRYILKQRSNDEMYLSEYPRQRGNVYSHGYRSLAAERENGTVAMTKHDQNYNSLSKSDDQTPCTTNLQERLDYSNSTHHSYFQPGIGSNDNKCLSGHTTSMPSQAPPNGHNVSEIPRRDCMIPQSGYFTNKIPQNNQQQQSFDPRKNNVIYEPVIIGGIKYLAKKPEYSRSDSSHYYSTNHGKVFNPTLTCHQKEFGNNVDIGGE